VHVLPELHAPERKIIQSNRKIQPKTRESRLENKKKTEQSDSSRQKTKSNGKRTR